MKPLAASDFRARRYMLEKDDFAVASGEYSGATNLIDEYTWKSIVVLPDDVSIRTSDKYGSQLQQMWEYWGERRGCRHCSMNPSRQIQFHNH
jgi:hypothetical protein